MLSPTAHDLMAQVVLSAECGRVAVGERCDMRRPEFESGILRARKAGAERVLAGMRFLSVIGGSGCGIWGIYVSDSHSYQDAMRRSVTHGWSRETLCRSVA